jgi:hypothetical protein
MEVTYPPVPSMWVVTLLSLFPYSDPPLPCDPLPIGSDHFFFPYNKPHFPKLVRSSHLPAYEDGTGCSETSAYKFRLRGINHKKAYNIQNTAKV